MSPKGLIETQQVWKRFRADRKGSMLAVELRMLKNQLTRTPYERWRWALRDINFRAEPGEAVGLIGANGSGKSTLLKILTRVMYPYAGRVNVNGRVGALIEVSAGIHGQLSGRENVYLYGTLLGLSRKEVARKFDEIIDFAEIDQAVDRLVKYYSSGMKMRLGFAVAAFLEPDILLVDEVLAVGDASFQQKCLDRMRTVLSQNTTLVFVSHDLPSVQATCSRGVWLANGDVQAEGPIDEVLGLYRQSIEEAVEAAPHLASLVRMTKSEILGPDGGSPGSQQPLQLRLVFESEVPRYAHVYIGVTEGTASPVFSVRREVSLSKDETEVRCLLPKLPLPRGRFYAWVGMWHEGRELLPWQPAGAFDVMGPDLDPAPRAVVRLAPIHVESRWEVESR